MGPYDESPRRDQRAAPGCRHQLGAPPCLRSLSLQRLAGNRAVGTLLASRPPGPGAAAARPRVDGRTVLELQRTAGNRAATRALQRYAYCTPARLSGMDCPPREKGEVKRAHDGAMVFLPGLKLDTGETGVLIANFDIGSAKIKPNLGSTIYWKQWLRKRTGDKSKWSLVGFTDCAGDEKHNAVLREQRAKAVLHLLPAELRTRIDSIKGAGPGECITENDGAPDRTLNRSVALLLTESTIDEPGEVVTDTLERREPSTSGCSADQRARLAVAVPLAKKLAEHAIELIDTMDRGSREEALFKKFFGPDAYAERWHIKEGYVDALRAWRDLPTYKCVPQGTSPCTGSTDAYTGARALFTGNPIIICEHSFGDDLELADTVLHEETHALAWTDDNEECGASGCSLPTTSERLPGIGLTDSGALTNAASYSRFASQAYAQGL
jgi:outer membrane protein OmpA-like peptidoglycan-associated protein